MTDHTDFGDANANTDDGAYDPLIAERFRVLDRVTPPDVSPQALAVPAPGGWHGPDPSGRRSGFLVAVAASVVVLLVGIVAVVAATGGGGGTDLAEEAGNSDGAPIVADGASDTTPALVVEGDSAAVSTTRSSADGEESDPGAHDPGASDAPDDGSVDDGSTANGSAAERGAGDSESGTADPSSGSTGSGSGSESGGSSGPLPTSSVDPPVMPADDGDRPVSTFSTATTDVLPTSGGGSGTVALSGTVTEVFTDCVSRLVLTETGQVVQGGPVTCDGGSSIVVDGIRVFTSSGYTSADLAFDKHPSNLEPGQNVSVTATRTGGATGPLTLDCDTCRVRIL